MGNTVLAPEILSHAHTCIAPTGQRRANYAYFPILIGDAYSLSRDALYQRLREHGIYARRYFYPLISKFPMYRSLPSARRDHYPAASVSTLS